MLCTLIQSMCLLKCFFIVMVPFPVPGEKKMEGRSRIDRESDNQQLLQLEEKDVVSSVATVLSDLCGPGEWMPMEKLHAEVSYCHQNASANSFFWLPSHKNCLSC